MSVVFYNQVDLKPHRSRDWLNAEPDEAAEQQMADLPERSLQAHSRLEAGERVRSTDEMTGIQALERTHPTMAMGPGRVERRAFADLRHGTVTLIANFDVAQGKVIAPSMGPTRTEEDVVAHMQQTVASEPAVTRWHVVADKLNTHQSESLVRCVAAHDGIEAGLGEQGKRGMLTSMATRAAFLTDATHSIVLHSTPNQASWMHQIAVWFSIVVRTLIKRASFSSTTDLEAQVLACIDYFHATMAKPLKWTSGRRPLSA
jgi:hypothetical protein